MPNFKYCRYCGSELTPGAVYCIKCGVPSGRGKKYCWNCGKQTAEEAVVCVGCGVQLGELAGPAAKTGKSKIAAGILGICLGVFGVHNFYLGYTGKAVAQLILGVLVVTSFISFIWGLVEGIMILTGSINVDGDGQPLAD